MKLIVTTEIQLDEADAHDGFVTWLQVDVAPKSEGRCAARAALVHVGQIADAHGDIPGALTAAGIDAIHDTYFAQGWYKDEFADGAGIDLLFFERITVDRVGEGKNLDLALVRRLCDTLGSGCQLVVVPYRSAHEAARWASLGFTVSTPGRTSGLLHLKLGQRQARVIDTTGRGDYEVLPSVGTWSAGGDRLAQN